MKVGNAVVMLKQVAQNWQGMLFVAVERAVDKFDLRYFLREKEGKLFAHALCRAKFHLPVNRGQAVAARKRASSAAFVINDPVLKAFHVLIPKRDIAKRKPWRVFRCQHIRQAVRCFLHIRGYKKGKGTFTRACHDAAQHPFLFDFIGVVGYFRPACPDVGIRQDFMQVANKLPDKAAVPDIAGKGDDVRLFFVDFLQQESKRLVNCKFDSLDMGAVYAGAGF